MQSLIEGVALRTAEAIRTMASLYRVSDEISIDGGVSANPYFCQFLADSLGKCVTVRPFSELTAIGTAQLAGAENILVDDDNARIQRFHPSVFRQDRIENLCKPSPAPCNGRIEKRAKISDGKLNEFTHFSPYP